MRSLSRLAVPLLVGALVAWPDGSNDVLAADQPKDSGAPTGVELDPRPLPPAVTAYLDGLEALAAAKWEAAAAAFAKALDADPDQAAYHRARGVALTLGEKFTDAIAELERASKLDPPDREARVWLAAAVHMTGDPSRAANIAQPYTNDLYQTFIGKIRVDYGELAFRQQRKEDSLREEAKRVAAKQKFPQAGAWYASRMMDTPTMARHLFVRAKQQVHRGQFAAALNDLEFVRRQFPREMAVLYYHAMCLTATGDPATGQREFTQVIARFPQYGNAYYGRAVASAKLGDARRARQDLATAERLSPQDVKVIGALVDKELAILKAEAPAGKPEELRQALVQAAQTSEVPFPKLVEQAVALHKAVRVRHLQEEEAPQARPAPAEGGVTGLLVQASKQMERTAWKTADKLLTQAAEVNPVDARVAAYQGIIRLADKKPAEALAAWRLALALEDARLRPMGITGPVASVGTRNPDELALLMLLRLRVASLELQRERWAEALDLARQNVALEKRIAFWDMLRDLPAAIWPDMDPKPFEHPEPENAASLLAWSHYYAGQALKGLKQRDEAAKHFQAAHAMGRSLTVGQGTRPLNEPRNRAGLALGWILLERGEVNATKQLLEQVDTTIRHSHSKELAAQMTELQKALGKAMQNRTGFGRP